MNKASHKCPEWHGKPGQNLSGFIIKRVTDVPEVGAVAVEAEHKYSGANVLQLYADDPENLFSIAFKTPPPDNTGVAHILEHSVLNGSKKYPVKEPFLEMLKMSMATFLNAMTYPDKTVYPAASNVKKDYFNLFDVYFDAVFHADITPFTFKQEGHHLAFEESGNIDSPLTIKGVVYNEMRGAFSDLDSLIARTGFTDLFRESTYAFESGGDPEKIPELTYEKFRQFFEHYYHPSNARVFLYGNIDPEENFDFLDARLQHCQPRPEKLPDVNIPPEKRWKQPKNEVVEYPIANNEDPHNKAALTINWLVGDLTDPVTDLAMEVLDQLLLGHSGAPLYKALLESQIGQDLTSSGYDNECWETTFHVGLKGTDESRKMEFESFVFDTLQNVVDAGFTEDHVERALHQMEYTYREVQSLYPLRLMEWVYNSWLYNQEPLTYLNISEHLEQLRAWYRQNPDCFTDLIRERLIDNKHRCHVSMKPVKGLQETRRQELVDSLEALRQQKSRDELFEIDREASALEEVQNEPNSAEDVDKLPQLDIDDIPSQPPIIPAGVENLKKGGPLICNELTTNGVNYVLIGFNLDGLPTDLHQYIPVFSGLLSRMGTKEESYDVMAERLAENTGRFQFGTFNGSDAHTPDRMLNYLTLSMKTLDNTLANACDIARELIIQVDFDDHDHLGNVLKQMRERAVSGIIPEGHRFAARHAGRNLSPLASLGYCYGGTSQVRLLNKLAVEFNENVFALKDKLEAVRQFVVEKSRVCASFTGTSNGKQQVAKLADLFGSGNNNYNAEHNPVYLDVPDGSGFFQEGIAVQADVAYCAQAWSAPHISGELSSAAVVLSQLLSFDYLWDEIRAKGGAYGAFADYNPGAGTFSFVSYRDPHIKRTLDVYDGALNYILDKAWSQEDIRRAVIGSVKSELKPVRPAWATAATLWRYMGSVSDELRQKRLNDLQQVDVDDVKNVAREILGKGTDGSNISVVSSREMLETEMGAHSSFNITDLLPST